MKKYEIVNIEILDEEMKKINGEPCMRHFQK